MVPSSATRRPVRRARRRRRATLSGRGGRIAVFGVIALAIFIVLLVAAFSSSVPSFQNSLPKDSAELLANGTPLQQVVATQEDLSVQLPISQRDVTALGYHGSDGNALPLKPIGRQAKEDVF